MNAEDGAGGITIIQNLFDLLIDCVKVNGALCIHDLAVVELGTFDSMLDHFRVQVIIFRYLLKH